MLWRTDVYRRSLTAPRFKHVSTTTAGSCSYQFFTSDKQYLIGPNRTFTILLASIDGFIIENTITTFVGFRRGI